MLSAEITKTNRRQDEEMLGRYRRMTVTRFNNKDLFFRVYILLACLSCGVGGVILTGGPERFSGPAFSGPRDLVSWLPWFDAWFYWGILFLAYGLAIGMVVRRQVAIHVLRLGLVIYSFLAVTFAWSVFQEPTAAATGCVAYSIFAVLSLFMSDHLETYGWEE